MFGKKKPTTAPVDSDSTRSPSDEEKPVIEKLAHGVLPDDPDSGASDAERAAIVSTRETRLREHDGHFC